MQSARPFMYLADADSIRWLCNKLMAWQMEIKKIKSGISVPIPQKGAKRLRMPSNKTQEMPRIPTESTP